MPDPKNIDERRAQLMGFMDGELTPEETADINNLLMRDAALRAEYESLCRACDKLERVQFDMPDEAELRKLWKSPFSSFLYRFAWLLILVPLAILIIVAGFQFLFNSGPFGLNAKTVVTAILIGLGTLLALVIYERVSTYSKDPYKDIEK